MISNRQGGADRGGSPAPRTARRPIALFGWLVTIVALVVAVVGLVSDRSADAAPPRQDGTAAQATATREAELREIEALETELSALQTKVAEPCLPPTPTVVPTPSAPAPSGQPVTHADDWTIVVFGAAARSSVAELRPTGAFIEVSLVVTNGGIAARTMPLVDLVLEDIQGRQFPVDTLATTRLDALWQTQVDPGQPREVRLIFDVAVDSGQPFVLQSATDPGFRVEVGSMTRG